MLLAAAMAPASAADSDSHMNDQSGPLCARSSFAHGYLHGYEDGFHEADQDIHMGRGNASMPPPQKAWRAGKSAPDGDRASFRKGYTQGYSAGFNDGISGRGFRAISELRIAAADLEAPSLASPPAIGFDRGFATGYTAGRLYTAKNAAPIHDFNYVMGYCLASAGGNPGPGYCDAYTRGFRVGYDDGALQRPEALAAKNGGN